MSKRILILQAHPETSVRHLCHGLADAYAEGAQAAGHEIRRVSIGALDFPVLRSQKEWETGALPAMLAPVQEDIRWAGHIVIVFPLWLGDMPALLKAFLEQVMRPGFAFRSREGSTTRTGKGLKGRSARVIVTMGMPAIVYRWFFRAHSIKSLERNILRFIGIGPVHQTLVGGVGQLRQEGARKWLARMRRLGSAAL